LNLYGSGSIETVIAGIERAVDPNQDGDFSDHVNVISMSLGAKCWIIGYNEYCGPDDPLSASVDNANDIGVVVVVAAGNNGPISKSIDCPGCARKAITVGASYKKDYEGPYWDDVDPRVDQITSFSSRGPVMWNNGYLSKPDVVAPGAIICAARYDNIFPEGSHDYYYPCYDEQHVQLAGTSMATPVVAGVAALIKQKHPDWYPEDIKYVISHNAIDLGYDENTQGGGRVDVLKAVTADKPNIPYVSIVTKGDFSGFDKIDIIGTAKAANFSNYVIEYAPDYDEYNWNFICNGNEEVEKSVLCEWDISFMPDGDYILRITVNTTDGYSRKEYSRIRIDNIKITSLKEVICDSSLCKKIFSDSDNPIAINGTAYITNFTNYSLCWFRFGYDELNCSKEGIYILNNSKPIISDVLGFLNTSYIKNSGYYAIKLCVFSGQGIKKCEDYATVFYLEKNMKKGWPKEIVLKEYETRLNPVTYDVNNDGFKEIFVFIEGNPGYLYAFNHNGNLLEGFPYEINTSLGYTSYSIFSIGDIDNDGFGEVVFSVFDYDKNTSENLTIKVYALNHDGTLVNGWPKIYDSGVSGILYINWVTTATLLSDLNLDGNQEIIFTTLKYLYVINSSGEVLNGWPKQAEEYAYYFFDYDNIPAIGNFDNDPELEILYVSSAALNKQKFSIVYAFNYDGSYVNGWPIETDYATAPSSPIIFDMNNDGKDEILLTGRNPSVIDNKDVFIVNNQGQIIKSNAIYPIRYEGIRYPAIFFDQDFIFPISTFYYLYFLNKDLNHLTDGLHHAYVYSGIPTIGYKNLFNTTEVLINTKYGVERITEYDDREESNPVNGVGLGDVVIDDIDGDNKIELVAASLLYKKIYGYAYIPEKAFVYVWETNISYNPRMMHWPMFAHDPQHTGLYAKPCNELMNPSFEFDKGIDYIKDWTQDDKTAFDGVPDGWFASGSYAGRDVDFSLDSESVDGSYSVRMDLNNTRAWVAQQIPVKYGRKYLVSGWIKTDLENGFGIISTHCFDKDRNLLGPDCGLDNFNISNRVYNKKDWQYFEFIVRANTSEAGFLQVQCYASPTGVDSEPATGTIWCDDFEVMEIEKESYKTIQCGVHCSDGTPSGQCAKDYGTPGSYKYCYDGKLFDNCQRCGCAAGYKCRSDGICVREQKLTPIPFRR